MDFVDIILTTNLRIQQRFVTIEKGRIQDFKLGGVHLKKLRRAEGGANISKWRLAKRSLCNDKTATIL
jgi:hypothetical protein